jgi:hypothetical protein
MLLPLKVHDFDALNLLEFNKVVEEVIAKRKADYGFPQQTVGRHQRQRNIGFRRARLRVNGPNF